MNLNEETIEDSVVSYYLSSHDYNGLPLSHLAQEPKVDWNCLLELVIRLVQVGRISIASPRQTNPFIKAFDASVEEQLLALDDRNPSPVCLYPTESSVRNKVDLSVYDDRPFTKEMILAKPKLIPIPFRMEVLDSYERDPRYIFYVYGFGGRIGINDEYSEVLEESDRIKVRFGVGYDDEDNRVVAVYLYHLAELPGRQQRIWKEYLIDKQCQMSEEFFTTTILGKPAEAISVHEAFLHEQLEINKLFRCMGIPPLFRETYENKRPPQFSFFVKPTQRSYDEFVHLLDKMLSDNINIDAFGGDVARSINVRINDGEVEKRQRGSISMLDEWLSLRYSDMLPEVRDNILDPLKEVRRLRQVPAHTVSEDRYDRKFHHMHDELIWKVYNSLHSLRRVLMDDPNASRYEPPYWDGRFTVKSF